MKENIYTIPVMDGFADEHECPFCNMKKKLEEDAINFVLGPSYMENDVRLETNKYGFCNHHIQKLYKEKNRLGLALMLHSHMTKTREQLEALLESSKPQSSGGGLKKLFGRSGSTEGQKAPVSEFINEKVEGCYICRRVDTTFDRYIDTFFLLLKKDPQMWTKLENSKGFCFEHFDQVYHSATKHLSAKDLERFINIVVPLQLENLKRVEEDLEWFTMKFDHRYKDAPWKNSKDAVSRSIVKTNGLEVE